MSRSIKAMREEAVKTLARLIASNERAIADDDMDILCLAAEQKVNVRTLERVIDKITDNAREDMVDILAESPDSRLLFRDVVNEALDIMADEGLIKRRRGYERSYDYGRGFERRRHRSERYEDEKSTDLGSIIDVLDRYMANNNIPFPSTESAFVALIERLKGKSNEPDIIAYTGSAKKLYKEMLSARKR